MSDKKDDWSLKGCELELDERGLIHNEDDDDYEDYLYYEKVAIDVLRQMLIDDLKNYTKKPEYPDKLFYACKRIINKRFGVESK